YPPIDRSIMMQEVTSRYYEVIGKCPLCGGNVTEGSKGFSCSNRTTPVKCGFAVWKRQQSGMFRNTEITAAMMKKLLAGKAVRMKKLVSNRGEKFEADIALEVCGDEKYPVKLTFAPAEELGICPKCGG